MDMNYLKLVAQNDETLRDAMRPAAFLMVSGSNRFLFGSISFLQRGWFIFEVYMRRFPDAMLFFLHLYSLGG